MFKVRKIIVVLMTLVYLLLLTACQTVPDTDDGTESSTPPSSSVAPTTQSTVPPASSTPPASEPATSVPATSTPATTAPITPPVDISDGHLIIFNGPPQSQHAPDWWPTEGLIGHLYWIVDATKESILICDEPVIGWTLNDTHIFFNKESEPTKVYATAIGDFTKYELIYESTYGNISYMNIQSDLQDFLQYVVDEKKFIILDIATGESTLLMEQDYIHWAWLYGAGDGVTWSEIIEFQGIATGKVYSDTGFTYNYVTGELGYGDS